MKTTQKTFSCAGTNALHLSNLIEAENSIVTNYLDTRAAFEAGANTVTVEIARVVVTRGRMVKCGGETIGTVERLRNGTTRGESGQAARWIAVANWGTCETSIETTARAVALQLARKYAER